MLSVPEAIDELREALRKKGVESHIHDAFNHLASCLVLLNSSTPSVQMIRKLGTVLRKPLLPLYNTCLHPALQLSSSVLSTVLGKLCDAHNAEDERLAESWDETAKVVLSGVLDFLDQSDGGNVGSDSADWEVLYRIICEFFFPDPGRGLPVFSIPLCLSAYDTLTETAVRQVAIQNALRRSAVLGGARLGFAISRTKDYLLLEALLMLFVRLLPPIHNTSQGKFKRAKFVKEVLGSPKLFKCSAELLDIIKSASGTQWDDVAAQITDALASSDITYPQPFSVDEIEVSGRVFPQPLATDRLIMDKQAFFANVVAENDDTCESLQVPYSHIRTITLDNSEQNVPKGKVLVMVYLKSPPLVADTEMKLPGGSHLYAKFLLQGDVVRRFMEALRRRGVGKLSFLNPLTRVQRKRKSISIGSGFKFIDDSSPIPPAGSFEGKVQRVNQVYKTDIDDLTTCEAVPALHVRDEDSSPMLNSKPVRQGENPVLEASDAVKRARMFSPAGATSKPIQDFTSPFSQGNSTTVIQSLGDDDDDKLSEISEFEPDNEAVIEQIATEVTAPCNHELKPTQHEIQRLWSSGSPNAISATGIKESSVSVSKTGGHAEGVVQKSPETVKPTLTADSPIFGSSSSTQINVSPKMMSNLDIPLATTGQEADNGLSKALVGKDRPKKSHVDGCGFLGAERITASVGKPPTGLSSRIGTTKDPSAPPKVAGNRRKRETIKWSSKAAIEVDDEFTPPRKKSCNDRLGMKEDRVKSDDTSQAAASISRVKRYTKPDKRDSSGTEPMKVDFDELPERKSTFQEARRSSRIKKRQVPATGPTRANVKRGKTRKGIAADRQSTRGVEDMKLAASSEQDTGVKATHSTPPILSSEPPPLKSNGCPPSGELGSTEYITRETNLSPEILKTRNILSPGSNQPAKESGASDSGQQATSDAMQVAAVQSRVKLEETMDDHLLVSNPRATDNDINRLQEAIEYPVCLPKSMDPVELSPLIMESTSRKEAATIDLTIDDSPVREGGEPRKASVGSVRSEAIDQTKSRTSEADRITLEEPTFVASPRHRRRNVTFASPIEYVLDGKVTPKTHIGSSSRRSPSPSESNILSPLMIPAGTMIARRGSLDRTASQTTLRNSASTQAHVEASVYHQTLDDAGIQDIVEVLNEIQAVIIKSISDKFKNIKKDAQHGRDELVHQVLDELRGMVIENAKYFNGLVRLEEDYYKNGQAITHCWEELIDCNDGIAVLLQKLLKEHDQNVSARIFPKSLVPLQPVLRYRRINA